MLEIRTFRSKRNGIRVDLYRQYKHMDSATQKVKFSYKQIGSFLLKSGYTVELIEKLQPDELLQLHNWLAEAKFAQQFQVEADDLSKFTLRIPQKFYDALLRLHLECKRIDIDFLPNEAMLTSLLQKAKLLQQKLDKVNGFSSGILESTGITLEKNTPQDSDNRGVDHESHALFKALLNLPHPIGKICTELETAAKKYGKQKRIPPPQLKEWAGEMPNRNPNKPIKKWVYAVAIEVLLQHQINPLSIVSAEKIADYWAFANEKLYSLQEAQARFNEVFHPPPAVRKETEKIIEGIYKKI